MATTTQHDAIRQPPRSASPPPLRNGDRLTRAEFERRYDAMPHIKTAELIEGIVYIPSSDFYLPDGCPIAVSFRRHALPLFDLTGFLGFYRTSTPGIHGAAHGSIRLDLDNMPQPDAFLLILPSHGGQARISEDDYVVGAPELIAEVAYSSASYDLYAKLHVYRRNQAREYVVWRVEDGVIDWFVLREGRYNRLPVSEDGFIRSEVFPGLWLDPAALIRGDLATVFQGVQRGLATPEHAAFVAELQRRAAAPGPPIGGERP